MQAVDDHGTPPGHRAPDLCRRRVATGREPSTREAALGTGVTREDAPGRCSHFARWEQVGNKVGTALVFRGCSSVSASSLARMRPSKRVEEGRPRRARERGENGGNNAAFPAFPPPVPPCSHLPEVGTAAERSLRSPVDHPASRCCRPSEASPAPRRSGRYQSHVGGSDALAHRASLRRCPRASRARGPCASRRPWSGPRTPARRRREDPRRRCSSPACRVAQTASLLSQESSTVCSSASSSRAFSRRCRATRAPAGLESRAGLRPELVAPRAELLDLDAPAPATPEAPRPGPVVEEGALVGAPDHDAGARHLDERASVGRPEAVDARRHEGPDLVGAPAAGDALDLAPLHNPPRELGRRPCSTGRRACR